MLCQQKIPAKYTLNNLRTSLLNKKISNSYKLGLIQNGRKKACVFKIVSLNWNKKVVDIVGYYNPKFGFSRIIAKRSFVYKIGKTLLIDFRKIYYWLYKRIFISGILYRIVRIFHIAYAILQGTVLTSLLILDPKYYISSTSVNQIYFFYNQIRSIENINKR